jgi:signal transduction histidine kinase
MTWEDGDERTHDQGTARTLRSDGIGADPHRMDAKAGRNGRFLIRSAKSNHQVGGPQRAYHVPPRRSRLSRILRIIIDQSGQDEQEYLLWPLAQGQMSGTEGPDHLSNDVIRIQRLGSIRRIWRVAGSRGRLTSAGQLGGSGLGVGRNAVVLLVPVREPTSVHLLLRGTRGQGRSSWFQENQARDVNGRNERFAALVMADSSAISASYLERLEAMYSPVTDDTRAREQVLANAAATIADVAESVRAGTVKIDDRYKLLARTIGESRAETRLSTSDSLRAAETLFEVTVTSLARHVSDDPELLPCFVIAVRSLNESISLRIRQASLAYTGYLLDRIHEAHSDERHRIARDLHDLLGEGLSGALRQLEVYEFELPEGQVHRTSRTGIVKEALAEAMRRLRVVTSELRQDSITSLEKGLLSYLDSAASGANVRLRVSGDERWASRIVIDEAFLIIREAIRNALSHGDPQMVLIGVALTPDELCAWVTDDGLGFVVAAGADPSSAGNGLASMHERAALVGGRLTVTSEPGAGTDIELVVPLTGRRNVQSI